MLFADRYAVILALNM